MLDAYQKRVLEHHAAVEQVLPMLMGIAQRLAPDYWVLQYTADPTAQNQERFRAVVHNGDGNVGGHGRTLGSAVAHLIGNLLDGAVFPLTGNGGRYIRLEDRDYYPEMRRKQRDEIRAELYVEVLKEFTAEMEAECMAKARVAAMDELRAQLGWVNDALITAR